MAATTKKTRFQTRAGAGLASVPSTPGQWEKSAKQLLEKGRKLSDINQEGKFSASTAPGKAVLSMRAIYLPARPYEDARKVLAEKDLLGPKANPDLANDNYKNTIITDPKMSGYMQRVQELSEEIHYRLDDRDSKPKVSVISTKKDETPSSISRHFGAFSSCFSAWLSVGRYCDGPDAATPKKLQINKILNSGQEERAVEGDRRDLDGDYGPLPGPKEPRRFPTESVIIDFTVELLRTATCELQNIGQHWIYTPDAFQRQFVFDLSGETTEADTRAGYCARVDGTIPAAGFDLTPLLLIEDKRGRRAPGQARTVKSQHIMEYAAVIKQCVVDDEADRSRLRSGERNHIIMVAQEGDDVRFGVGTFHDEYLEYLASAESLVIPDEGGLEEKHFLRIEEFGPFNIADPDEFQGFSRINYWLLQKLLDTYGSTSAHRSQ